MATHAQVVDGVRARLRASFGALIHVLPSDEDSLNLRIGSSGAALVSLLVTDPDRPSFAVSYPALKVKRNGRRHVQRVHANGVLIEGIEWIVQQLAEHGVVRPEFE
jgi:hypothetical protein